MLSAHELQEEHDRSFDGRPQRIQRVRDSIREYTGLDVPRGASDVEQWYSNKKGVITRRLNERVGDDDPDTGGED